MLVLIPGIPLVAIMVDVEAFNGFVLPIVLGFLIALAGSKRILGEYAYSKKSIAAVGILGLVMVILGIMTALPQSWLNYIHL